MKDSSIDLKRGRFTPFQLLCGHEPEPPERQPLDPGREGLDLTGNMAERIVRKNSAHKEWLDTEVEHRVSSAQNTRTQNHRHWPRQA